MASLDHIIVLMMENNSFDRMLGSLFAEKPDAGGIRGTARNHWNDDDPKNPNIRYYMASTRTHKVQPDPGHELPEVLDQIQGPNKFFVNNFCQLYPNSTVPQRQEIMGYYDDGDLPVLHTMAKTFTVCDRWFSSIPGPTWPNRVFVHTGTSKGYVNNSVFNNWDQTTIYQVLDNNGISWKIYHGDGDPSQTSVLKNTPLTYAMKHFFVDVQKEGSFPQYCFIEPNFGTFSKAAQNDQHPPSDVYRGEQLIQDIYRAIRASDALWQRCLLVVTYDEHGGFYDHVLPPTTAVRPDNEHVHPPVNPVDRFEFTQFGVRVPTILISPWLDQGVISDVFDHTGILKFICDKWGLGNYLGNRVASSQTNTFARYLRKTPRNVPKPTIKLRIPDALPPADQNEISEFQESLIQLGQVLAERIEDPVMRHEMLKPQLNPSPSDRARRAVEQFQAYQLDLAKNPKPPAKLKPMKTKSVSERRPRKRRRSK